MKIELTNDEVYLIKLGLRDVGLRHIRECADHSSQNAISRARTTLNETYELMKRLDTASEQKD